MKRIAELRKQHNNMTQDELAKKLGVSQQTISKYERGLVEPDSENLKKLATLFGVTVDYIIECSDVKSMPSVSNIPAGIYMRLAKEAEEMQLDKEDIDYIINLYKRFRQMNK